MVEKTIVVNEDAYVVGVHRYCYKAGEPAKILGVRYIALTDHPARFCFEVEYPDGKIDLVPYFDDSDNYEIVSAGQVKHGNLPEIRN